MKIIVADDHYTNRLLVLEILRTLGHDSIEAENGQQVLEALEKHNDIDLVFLDIEMPIMGGFETMKHIRQKLHYPKNVTPIVALTAHNEDVFYGEHYEAGFNCTLLKPFSIDKIVSIINEYSKSS